MADYPIILQLQDRLCVVVGAGAVGLRKARGLLRAGARVRLIDPALEQLPADLAAAEVLPRPYRSGDLTGATLAFAASGQRTVNAAVTLEARQAGIPVNVADCPEDGDFTLPALLRRGALTIGVGTGGSSPALAALVRDHLAGLIGPEWTTVVEIAAALRQKRLTDSPANVYNPAVLGRLVSAGLPGLIASGDRAAVDRLLGQLLGEEISLASLRIRIPKGMP